MFATVFGLPVLEDICLSAWIEAMGELRTSVKSELHGFAMTSSALDSRWCKLEIGGHRKVSTIRSPITF
jgi:hypothetical protein